MIGVISSPKHTSSEVIEEVNVILGESGILTVKYLIPLEHSTVSALTQAVPSNPFRHTTSKNSLPPMVVVEVLDTAIAGSTFQTTGMFGLTLNMEVTVPVAGMAQTGRSVALITGISSLGLMVMVLQTQPRSSLKPSLSLSVESSHETGRTQTSN